MRLWLWHVLYLAISGIITWLANPATFGIGLKSGDVSLNVLIRVIVFGLVYLILILIARPKKKKSRL